MSEKLSEEMKALMGTFAAAEAALAEAAAVWRQFRQPRVDTAAGHKKANAMEREAQFRLANAALLWLWHVEERAARAEARPAPVVDREAVARIVDPIAFKCWQATYDYGRRIGDSELEALETAEWAHGKSRDEALAKADAILALLSPAVEPPSRDNAGGGG